MVRIKVFKLSQLIYWAVIIVVAVALVGLIASAFFTGEEGERSAQPLATPSPETLSVPDAGGLPSRGGEADRLGAPGAASSLGGTSSFGFFATLSKWIFGVDLSDPASLLGYHLPVMDTSQLSATAVTTLPASSSALEDEAEGEVADGEHIRVEIARITEPYRPVRGKILIYHTHTYEAYEQDPQDLYVEAWAQQWRTQDETHSIVAVGTELARQLRAMGYEVVHDTTEFEPPKHGTAYERSLAMLQQRSAAGEEYAMVIDLHRDAWEEAKRTLATVNGNEAARVMMLIGTGEGSGSNTFSIKPNWQENYKLADALTSAMNRSYPGLCRDVLIKTGRYNQHMSEHSVLIEVGNQRNTLSDALHAVPALAEAIDEVLAGV